MKKVATLSGVSNAGQLTTQQRTKGRKGKVSEMLPCQSSNTNIKVPKYLEWIFECSKKHSEKKLAQKNTQQIKSTFLSPQIIAQ